jgi:RecB family exonuclease
MPGFTLNIAVDHLLKKEFDTYRAAGTPHPLMKRYKIDALPFQHEKLNTWRTNFTGVERHHAKTNLNFFGAVDDVWVNPAGELLIVDYKATSKKDPINLDEGWGPQYKRQMEFYQWLLRGNGFSVSDTGYFVYANGIKDREAFNEKLEFNVEVIPYTGSEGWIEETIQRLHRCLLAEEIPEAGERCEYCPYREGAGKALLAVHQSGRAKQGKVTPKETKEEATRPLF